MNYHCKLFLELFVIINSPISYISIIAIGYWNFNKNLYKDALFILLLAIIINSLLKAFFQIPPLPNHLGWSFPSGHAHAAGAFWLYLALFYRNNLFYLFIVFLLTFIGISIVFFEYHYPLDVISAYAFAICTNGIYFSIKRIIENRDFNKSLFVIISMCYFLSIPITFIPSHNHAAIIGILTFIFGSSLEKKYLNSIKKNIPFNKRIQINMIGLSVLIGSYLLLMKIPTSLIKPQITLPLSYFLCSFWVSFLIPLIMINMQTVRKDKLKTENVSY